MRFIVVFAVFAFCCNAFADGVKVELKHAIKNGAWFAKYDTVAQNNEDGSVTVKGSNLEDAVASDWIVLEQQTSEPIEIWGWQKIETGNFGKKTLIALDALVRFADGTKKWYVLPPARKAEAGKWVQRKYKIIPPKPIQAIRVLGLNYYAEEDCHFKDVEIVLQKKRDNAEKNDKNDKTDLNVATDVIKVDLKHAIKNGAWFAKYDTVARKNEDGSVTVKGSNLEDAVASDWIVLEQQTAEPIEIWGWQKIETGNLGKKTLIALDALVRYTDGTKKYYVLPPARKAEAGKWVQRKYKITPPKPIQAIRVLGLNYYAEEDCHFKDVEIILPKKKVNLSKVEKNITLENRFLKIDFTACDGIVSLGSFQDKVSGVDFIDKSEAKSNLWKLLLKKTDGDERSMSLGGGTVSFKKENDLTLDICWKDVAAFEGKDKINVTATVSLSPDKPRASWKISMEAAEGKTSPLEFSFPVISGMKTADPPEKTFLLYTQDIGRLIQNPSKNLPGTLSLRYGTWYLAMQFMALYGEKGGVYIDAEDGEGYFKTFSFSKPSTGRGFRFEICTRAPDGVVKYEIPYSVTTQTFTGDWFDACQIYREWAIRQKWCQQGPLLSRKDFPAAVARTGLGTSKITGYRQGKNGREFARSLKRADYSRIPDEELYRKLEYSVDVDENVKVFKKLRDYYGFPLEASCHPYLEPFGGGTPRFLLREGASEMAKRLAEIDCFVSPWTTIHRFDVNIPQYAAENVEKAALVAENGKPVKEIADAVMKASMCMATDYWPSAVKAYTRRLLSENMCGIYYDELSSSGAALCFSRHHRHHPGGGNYGLQARRQVLLDMHREFSRKYPNFYTLGEETTEFFIGACDVNFMYSSFYPDSVPAFQAVYHDYAYCSSRAPGKFYEPYAQTYYTNKKGNSDLEEFAVTFCRSWSFGIQPGQVRIDLPEYAPQAAMLAKNLGQAWTQYPQFLVFGRMLEFPRIINGNAEITMQWTFRDAVKRVFPAVYTSAWLAQDGSVAITLANASRSELAPEIVFDASKYVRGSSCVVKNAKTNTVLYAGTPKKIQFRTPIEGYSAQVFTIAGTENTLPAVAGNNLPPFVVWMDHDLSERTKDSRGKIKIFIENLSEEPAKGYVSVQIPETWKNPGNAKQDFELHAKAKKEFIFDIFISEKSSSEENFSYSVQLNTGKGVSRVFSETIAVGLRKNTKKLGPVRKYVVKYAPSLNMDSSFEQANTITNLAPKFDGLYSPPTAIAKMLWNESETAMEFIVDDPIHHSPEQNSEIWRGDCIQLVFGIFMPDQDAYTYRNVFLAQVKKKPFVFCLEETEFAKLLKLSVRRKDKKTVYRLMIPTPALKLQSNMQLSFSFTVNENDGDGFRGWLEWTPGVCGGFNPKAFGVLSFSKQ